MTDMAATCVIVNINNIVFLDEWIKSISYRFQLQLQLPHLSKADHGWQQIQADKNQAAPYSN
jgi:hypothetical protein